MIRALLELIVTLIVVMAARAILGSFMRGFANSARTAPPPAAKKSDERATVAGELHKDPVCGMYVAESTRFQRSSGRDRFYYCSEECKDKHAVAAR